MRMYVSSLGLACHRPRHIVISRPVRRHLMLMKLLDQLDPRRFDAEGIADLLNALRRAQRG